MGDKTLLLDLVTVIVEFAPRLELTKRTLQKTIGNSCLTEKQLITVLIEIEVILNSHPLMYLMIVLILII